MITGLKLDVRAEELSERLHERIAHHRRKAEAYDAQLRRLGEIQTRSEEDDEDIVTALREGDSPRRGLERKRNEHLDRVAILTFLREHIAAGEVYRLDEQDLRLAEILPRYRW